MSANLYVDMFPVNIASIPPLFAYNIKAISNDLSSVGGKLAYRLKNKFGGNWIWCNGKIISDKEITEDDLHIHLKELWEKEDSLSDIQGITLNPSWKPLASEIGDFAARGLLANYQAEIRKILDPKKQNFGKIRIDRDYSLRGWAVGEQPTVSISVSSNIVHVQNLDQYASGVKDHEELIGMMVVVVSAKDFKGEICEITGELSEKREWLLAKSKDETTRNFIKRAPDNELTVKIATRTSQYVYIASMLRPIVRMGDLQRFGVNPRQVAKALKLDPMVRFNLVREIAAIGKKHNIILDGIDTKNTPQAFLTTKEVKFVPELRVGNNQIHKEDRIYQSLQKHGLFSRSPSFPDKSNPIRIGIINASPKTPQKNLQDFLGNLKSAIDELGFSIESVRVDGQPQQKIERLTRANLESAVNRIEPHKPHILLVLFPGDAGQEQADDDEDSMYHALKSYTIRHGIPSQVVYENTFENQYAIQNIAMGILAKTRNIPFVLAKPLPYADIVVGIDIARRQKKKLSGSVNATAIARIYFSDGQFLRYVIHDAPIDGETIPPKVLQDLFPMKEFQGKKVIIHRDGLFRGEEKQALKNWASQIQSEFFLVEIIKSGAPRIYQQTTIQQTTTIDKPAKGTAFKLNSNEAFLVSSPPPFKGATPRPLHIRTDGDFSIENAIHSVLSLTLLHYGSVTEPRLPVTIHYSDKIAELALLGIKPKDLEGDMPFWL